MRRRLVLGTLAAMMLLSGCFAMSETEPISSESKGFIESQYDPLAFSQTVLGEVDQGSQADIQGMICPHHMLAADMLHEAFQVAANPEVEHIVLIGPDHKSEQPGCFSISSMDWSTPFGSVAIDDDLNAILEGIPRIQADNELSAAEHSVSSLMPFVAMYFPEARVNTLTVPAFTSAETSRMLGQLLANQLDAETSLVIASIDFSHGLEKEEADRMDAESLDLIGSWNLQRIERLRSSHLDSAGSLMILLAYLDSINSKGLNVLEHGNAFDYIPVEDQGTTSYYTIIFGKDGW